jgi:hypothetical protein
MSWQFQIVRSAVAEHQRVRARHPLPDAPTEADLVRRDGGCLGV